jgi:hypothetical protein|tara:strand:- start:68 stop:304 length:237 start_codon:yes stop_codon:yes gene_type:complete
MRDMLLAAAKSYYVGHINKHIANVEVYLRTSVGIGEHSDIIESIDKEIAEIGKYDDRLAMILKYFETKKEEKIESKKK